MILALYLGIPLLVIVVIGVMAWAIASRERTRIK